MAGQALILSRAAFLNERLSNRDRVDFARRTDAPRRPVPPRAATGGVDVRIEYCEVSNYGPVAARLADELRTSCGVEPRRSPARGGVFEVYVNGRLIFSKRANRRLPEPDEIFFHVGAAQRAQRTRMPCAASAS